MDKIVFFFKQTDISENNITYIAQIMAMIQFPNCATVLLFALKIEGECLLH